jgi:hypothetical protein
MGSQRNSQAAERLRTSTDGYDKVEGGRYAAASASVMTRNALVCMPGPRYVKTCACSHDRPERQLATIREPATASGTRNEKLGQ